MLPIQIAANRGNAPLIKLLARHGADLEVVASNGKTPVMLACQVLIIININNNNNVLMKRSTCA